MAKDRLLWMFAALAGTGIMATLGVFVRQVSPGNEFAIALGRFGIGLLCLVVLRALTRPGQAGERPARLWVSAGSGVFLALFVVSYFKAVMSGTLASAAFLLYLGPLIASTLAAAWLGEGLDWTNGLLLGCALLGTVFITEFKLPTGPAQVESLVFGFLSGVFYGLFLLFNNPRLSGNSAGLSRTFTQFAFATLVMIPVIAVAGANLTLADVPWILAIGVLHGFLALTLVIAALGHLKTIEYGTLSYGEPVAAALLGVVLYDERLSAWQIIGGGLVLAAGLARVLIREAEHPTSVPAVESGDGIRVP